MSGRRRVFLFWISLAPPFLVVFCWLPCPLRKRDAPSLNAEEPRYPLARPRCTRYFVRARPHRQAASDANSPASIAKEDPCPPRPLIFPPSDAIYIGRARHLRSASLGSPPHTPSISATLILSLSFFLWTLLALCLSAFSLGWDPEDPYPTCTYTSPARAPR